MKQFYQSLFLKRKSTKNYLKNAFAGLALLFAGYNTVDAQVNAYSFAQSSGTFTPITGTVLGTATGNTSATNLNSEVYPVSLPFGFNFNQTVYNSLNVSTNGFITFGSTAPTATNTTPINSTATYEGSVSAWGRDISSFFDVSTKTGNISWETVGIAPNREIVIQWTNFRTNSATAVTSVYSFSFQIRLSETSNQIKVVYDAGSYLVGNTSVASTAQIGLRGAGPDDFNNRLNATTLGFTSSTAGIANNSTQAFNTVNAVPGMPSAGLTYTWVPPTCWAPSNLLSNSTTPTTGNISWTASSSVPSNGYDVYYSTTNVAPTSSTAPLQQSTSTSAVLSPLAPSTVYYVWVRANCGSGNLSSWVTTPLVLVTKCQPPLFTTTGATVCPNQTANLTATAPSGSVVTWYDSSTGTNVVGTGSSFTTPALTTTTEYYATAANIASSTIGKTDATTTTGYTLDAGLLFDAYSDITINGVYVYPMGTGAGTVQISLQDGNLSPATTLQTVTVNMVGTAAPYVKTFVPLNFIVTPGTNYKLMMITRTGLVSGLLRESGATWGSYPFSIQGAMAITGGNLTDNNASTSYYYFYDWQVTTKCESARTLVTATVDTNCLSTSETTKKDAIKVYPNPFSEVVNITKPELVKMIQVSDLSGKLIKTINQPESVIRLNDLSSGMYLLQLDMKDGSKQTIKVIKK